LSKEPLKAPGVKGGTAIEGVKFTIDGHASALILEEAVKIRNFRFFPATCRGLFGITADALADC